MTYKKTKNNNIIANLYNFFTRIEYSDKYENVTKPAMFKVLKVVTIAEDVTLISFFLVIYFDLLYKNYNENVFIAMRILRRYRRMGEWFVIRAMTMRKMEQCKI